MQKKLLGLFLIFSPFSFGQVIDFENVKNKVPGQAIQYMTVGDNPNQIRFFVGHDLKDTVHLSLQEVGLRVENEDYLSGGFQGIINSRDCSENLISQTRMNQMNYDPFYLNPEINNRKRVGCRFVSTALRGTNLPSVFVSFSLPTKACSGDILDLDGANDAIEAYDIYYYRKTTDFPANPIKLAPIMIRTKGRSMGSGEIGEDGGVEHFSISSEVEFTLIEIRPIQQVSPENKLRDVFGFALDNFSPFEVEKPPYLPPYLLGESPEITVKTEVNSVEIPQFEPIYFDYDSYSLKTKSPIQLDEYINFLLSNPTKKIQVIGHTDLKGDADYNLKLSENRVKTVQYYLIAKGISQNRITVSFRGELEANKNSDPDWKNRKVEIVLF